MGIQSSLGSSDRILLVKSDFIYTLEGWYAHLLFLSSCRNVVL